MLPGYASAAALAALLLIGSSAAAAEQRGRHWEGTLQLIGTSSESSNGEMGSGIDVDSEVGWGFGATYHFNPNFAVGFDGTFVRPKYTAVFNTDEDGLVSLRHRASIFNGHFNGTWNILKGDFTPYLQLGLGWTHVDSNIADGPPVTGCWWDPWWGYVCADFFSTYEDTRFSWGAGAGLRYDFDRMFVKGSINRIELDAGSNAVDPTFDMWKLEIGMRFN
jgi:opacity protein-like surface antigen